MYQAVNEKIIALQIPDHARPKRRYTRQYINILPDISISFQNICQIKFCNQHLLVQTLCKN